MEIRKFEYLENKKIFLVEVKSIFHNYLRTVIWWKNEKWRTQALILRVSHVIDKIPLEISVIQLQVAILFECLCFNTAMIKYFFCCIFLWKIFCCSFSFCEINVYSLNCLYCLPRNMGKFHTKNNATF